jgi:hypothetical protein
MAAGQAQELHTVVRVPGTGEASVAGRLVQQDCARARAVPDRGARRRGDEGCPGARPPPGADRPDRDFEVRWELRAVLDRALRRDPHVTVELLATTTG